VRATQKQGGDDGDRALTTIAVPTPLGAGNLTPNCATPSGFRLAIKSRRALATINVRTITNGTAVASFRRRIPANADAGP